jgi:hypothetical protein
VDPTALAAVVPTPFILDTGAYERALDAQTAAALNLPNLGATDVGGVGGQAQAFNTQVDVQLGPGGPVFKSVPAVAIEGFGQNLWGLRFAVDNRLKLTLDTVTATLTYEKG